MPNTVKELQQEQQAKVQQDIRQLINDAKGKVEKREAVPPISSTPSPTLPFPQGDEEQERQAIIPYQIVKTLSRLSNIYETRLFGWVLAKAQSVLKLYNKDLSQINVQHAMDLTRVTIPARLLLGDGDKNYKEVTKAFELATKKIEYERENRLYHLNIIAFPELIKDGRASLITFVIHSQLWHALLDFSKGYRTFSVSTFMKLKSTYSVILYLIITNQKQPKTYTIRTLRELTGTDGQKGYDKTGNFVTRIVEVARRELTEKAPWTFEYSLTQRGKCHKIEEIVIAPRQNQGYTQSGVNETSNTAALLRIGLDDEVRNYLTEKYQMTPKEVERVEPLLMRTGDKEKQLERLNRITLYMMGRRIRNKAGYVYTSLKTD